MSKLNEAEEKLRDKIVSIDGYSDIVLKPTENTIFLYNWKETSLTSPRISKRKKERCAYRVDYNIKMVNDGFMVDFNDGKEKSIKVDKLEEVFPEISEEILFVFNEMIPA